MNMSHRRTLLTSLTAVAACALAACGGGSNSSSFPITSTSTGASNTTTLSGVVAASGYVPGSATGNPTLKAGYYQNAKVFLDANGNGVLDSGEVSTVTDANGKFTLKASATGQLVADITTSATNTATGSAVAQHLVLRASAAQIADQGVSNVVISPLSSEAQRLVEARGTDYATEKAHLATRLSGPAFNLGNASVADPLADVNTLSGAAQYAVLYEDNQLTNRYTYATAKLDRGDMYPDHLAVTGGDPRLVGSGASPATIVQPTQTQAKITFAQAQQAAFNVEGVPAYDHIFVIVEENKSSGAILGNPRVPYMNAMLSKFNQLTTYYSTGNPSEPNYTALGGGDDYGITDDNWFGCGAQPGTPYVVTDKARAASVASDGQPLPATFVLPTAGGTETGGQNSSLLAGYSTTATAACGLTPTSGTVHNIPGANLFTLLSQAGLTARTYSESMNPGQDARADSVAEAGITATYTGAYVTDDLLTQAAIDGNPSLTSGALVGTANYAVAGGLYKVKHGPSIAWQDARNLPEFFADNRTIFGTQYQEADWKKSTAYAGYDKSAWVYDQFSRDLDTGDVGNINFIVPDQCDDMHGVGSDVSCANNNNGAAVGLTRADIYLQKVISKIRNSALWKNPQQRNAIVVIFDEGEGSSTACCGWNPSKTSGAQPLTIAADGTITKTSPTNYQQGNFGHGQTIFGVMTNQHDLGKQNKGVVDSDSYSHFSLVRTFQDMFQLADPAKDATYLNRAKYTEHFVLANITNLPELQSSADTHFDAVRPINHAYVIPASYQQRLNPADYAYAAGTAAPSYQTGPDATQESIWGSAR
ncbi:alkaline phosphatase family protein [Variovorax sp. YR216]|uniref:alkaline phosphatase family protein n=1 Tax=Variovorax sp. YR216 TaxID=1882828 RepID=UPI0008977488|nr:alkaline phosphatase family protein [Variovorax sp. YR216]SEB03665.1 Phosphoesterase family protein [Variovorax sp. YR216]